MGQATNISDKKGVTVCVGAGDEVCIFAETVRENDLLTKSDFAKTITEQEGIKFIGCNDEKCSLYLAQKDSKDVKKFQEWVDANFPNSRWSARRDFKISFRLKSPELDSNNKEQVAEDCSNTYYLFDDKNRFYEVRNHADSPTGVTFVSDEKNFFQRFEAGALQLSWQLIEASKRERTTEVDRPDNPYLSSISKDYNRECSEDPWAMSELARTSPSSAMLCQRVMEFKNKNFEGLFQDCLKKNKIQIGFEGGCFGEFSACYRHGPSGPIVLCDYDLAFADDVYLKNVLNHECEHWFYDQNGNNIETTMYSSVAHRFFSGAFLFSKNQEIKPVGDYFWSKSKSTFGEHPIDEVLADCTNTDSSRARMIEKHLQTITRAYSPDVAALFLDELRKLVSSAPHLAKTQVDYVLGRIELYEKALLEVRCNPHEINHGL